MKLTAVVVAYWPSRFPSIPEIVADLRNGTRVPDHIMVFNNNHRQVIAPIEGASVINAGWNYTSRSKYAAAMLEPSDYYLLLDDDISVNRECVEYYTSIVTPGCCMSDCGMIFQNNFAHASKVVSSLNIGELTPVDMFIGCLQLVSFRAIVNMFAAEESLRLPFLPRNRSIGDDLLIALANRPRTAIFPASGYHNRTAKPQGTSAMQFDGGYYQARDLFAYDAWIALGNSPFPGGSPRSDPHLHSWIDRYYATVDGRESGTVAIDNAPRT